MERDDDTEISADKMIQLEDDRDGEEEKLLSNE